MNYIILISTPDSRGLVHKISSNLLDFNIEKNDEFVDKENEYFFMRTEISVEGKISSLGEGNSSLELHSADSANFECSQTISLVSHSKFAENYESQTENPSVVLNADSTNSSLRDESMDSPKQSTHFCDSKNDKNQIARSATLKALSGAGVGVVREGEGSDFAIQAPTPSLKKNARGQKGEFNADLSAESRKKTDSNVPLDSRDLDSLLTAFAQNDDMVVCHDSALPNLAMTSGGDSHKSPRNGESSVDSYDSTQSAIESRLRKILPPQSFIKVTQKRKKSIVIFCTKEAHCLGDLLIKHYNNELDIDIKAVIANHADLGALVEKFHIPYFHISHDLPNFEDSMLEVCARFAPDFIVLAKYMRILSPHFIAHYENRIINIHHSFLPAFIGANPYKQAYTRGVKIIGATAHFVTSELDSGPIICQDIMQVNHTLSWRDMQKAGRNIERVVLARAVELAIDERIFIHKNKTIIF